MLSIFNISLLLKGFPLKKATTIYAEIKSTATEKITEINEQKRNEIVSYHLKNNPFYRDFVNGIDCNVWKNIPTMSKKDFQIPLEKRLSNGFTKKNSYINKTSGSSGNPFIFAKDKLCHALTWIDIQEKFGWYQIDFNHSLQARFYGIPLDYWANKKEKFKDFLSRRHRFSIFDLSDKKLDEILKTFRKKKFDYINGYTTAIVLFAKYLERNNLVLKNECSTLRYCIVTSEMLLESDKKLLEKHLGVPVLNEYGASEVGLIAFENPNGDWLINTETLLVEILDESNQPVPNGTEGKIVITSLFNKTHPIIRYDIGDIGIIDEKSTSTRQILKKLVGRTNDFAHTPSGKKVAGMTFYSMTKKIMEEDGTIQEFIVRQKKLDTFCVEYVAKENLSDEKEKQIMDAFSMFLEPNLIIEFSKKSHLETKSSGKRQQFISEL